MSTSEKKLIFFFQANDNQLNEWKDIEQLAKCTKLETVYFERNPIQTDAGTQYRRRLIVMLPQLKQIDATYTRI